LPYKTWAQVPAPSPILTLVQAATSLDHVYAAG
jgi:hypothetical protein